MIKCSFKQHLARESVARGSDGTRHMRIGRNQLIVLAGSLLAFGGGVGGLIVVSRMPPASPTQAKKSPLPSLARFQDPERHGTRGKKPTLPQATDAPPLAVDNAAATSTDDFGESQPRVAEKKAPAQASSAAEKSAHKDDETIAAEKLKEARDYLAQKNIAKAKERCDQIIDKYLNTKAAQDAILLRNELK